MKWIAVDIATTGLDPDRELVCEVGFKEVDLNLNTGRAFASVCGGDGQVGLLENGNRDYVLGMHQKSGLLDALRSRREFTMENLERDAVNWLTEIGYKASDQVVLLGSSLRLDRNFLDRHMPGLSFFFHYRMIDVSTIKELCRAWQPEIFDRRPVIEKEAKHRVLDDIDASLRELRYYRSFGFIGERM